MRDVESRCSTLSVNDASHHCLQSWLKDIPVSYLEVKGLGFGV